VSSGGYGVGGWVLMSNSTSSPAFATDLGQKQDAAIKSGLAG